MDSLIGNSELDESSNHRLIDPKDIKRETIENESSDDDSTLHKFVTDNMSTKGKTKDSRVNHADDSFSSDDIDNRDDSDFEKSIFAKISLEDTSKKDDNSIISQTIPGYSNKGNSQRTWNQRLESVSLGLQYHKMKGVHHRKSSPFFKYPLFQQIRCEGHTRVVALNQTLPRVWGNDYRAQNTPLSCSSLVQSKYRLFTSELLKEKLLNHQIDQASLFALSAALHVSYSPCMLLKVGLELLKSCPRSRPSIKPFSDAMKVVCFPYKPEVVLSHAYHVLTEQNSIHEATQVLTEVSSFYKFCLNV